MRCLSKLVRGRRWPARPAARGRAEARLPPPASHRQPSSPRIVAGSGWVASVTANQTLTRDPANGSWTVVVKNADGQPGVNVTADLGATMPTLVGIAVGSLVAGGVFLVVGALLIGVAIRRSRAPRVRAV